MVESLAPAPVQSCYRAVEGSHTRKHRPAAYRRLERVGDDFGRCVDPLEHAQHGFDVADSAIDDRDVHDRACSEQKQLTAIQRYAEARNPDFRLSDRQVGERKNNRDQLCSLVGFITASTMRSWTGG